MPRRVQMTRQRPWRAEHPDAVIVARPSKWGNLFRLGDRRYGLVRYGPTHLERFGREWDYEGRISAPGIQHDLHMPGGAVIETHVRLATAAEVVELYRRMLTGDLTPAMRFAGLQPDGLPARHPCDRPLTVADVRHDLAGRDLACWCPLDQPCHGDVLLELANPGWTP